MFSRIQMNSLNDYPKTILVTSAIPSEGKSLISANLAYSCANHGKKTILIDFDLRRPGIHKFCNITNEKGLLSLINSESIDSEELKNLPKIQSLRFLNLFVLPSVVEPEQQLGNYLVVNSIKSIKLLELLQM